MGGFVLGPVLLLYAMCLNVFGQWNWISLNKEIVTTCLCEWFRTLRNGLTHTQVRNSNFPHPNTWRVQSASHYALMQHLCWASYSNTVMHYWLNALSCPYITILLYTTLISILKHPMEIDVVSGWAKFKNRSEFCVSLIAAIHGTMSRTDKMSNLPNIVTLILILF